MPDPIFIGYYTDGPYETDARVLMATYQALGLEHDLLNIGKPGSWQSITQQKAIVVRDMMGKHRGRPVVYVDVDALLVCRPELFWRLDCDVAATVFCGNELLSGTVYFGPTDGARRLVDEWIAENERHPVTLPDGRAAWDQRTLHRAIKKTGANFVELPQDYAWIPGLTQKEYPDSRPVVCHTRGSLRHNPTHK